MKIVITGYSGSGKSTLCRKLASIYNVPLLHMDTIQFLPNWEERDNKEKQKMIESFLDDHKDGWVIDGNYQKLSYERRIDEADIIIQLLFGRIDCLCRCFKRLFIYKGKTRPDITNGCEEKIDLEFIRWILYEGRSKAIQDSYLEVQRQYKDKVVIIRNQKQLDKYIKEFNN